MLLFLMLTFSLSLTTGCQEANEKAVEVNEEAAETKAGNKKACNIRIGQLQRHWINEKVKTYKHSYLFDGSFVMCK